MSSSRTRVDARVATLPVRARSIARTVVTAMAAHGVRRPGSTLVSAPGSSPSFAMP